MLTATRSTREQRMPAPRLCALLRRIVVPLPDLPSARAPESVSDLLCRLEHVPDVARERARLLGGRRYLIDRRLDASIAEDDEIEPDVLQHERCAVHLTCEAVTPPEQVVERGTLTP